MSSTGGGGSDDDGSNDTFFDALAGKAADEPVLGVVVRPSSPAPLVAHRAAISITIPSRIPSRSPSRGRSVDRQSAQPAAASLRPFQRSPRNEPVPQVPRIPARFLDSGRPASVTALPRPPSSPLVAPTRRASWVTSAVRRGLSIDAPKPARLERSVGPLPSHRRSFNGVVGAKQQPDTTADPPSSSPKPPSPALGSTRSRSAASLARRKSLPAQVHQATLDLLEAPRAIDSAPTSPMVRQGRARRDSSFVDMDRGQLADEDRPASRSEEVDSPLSYAAKRRSLPAESALAAALERRPRLNTTNATARPSSRLHVIPNDLQRHVEHYRTPPSISARDSDARSVSGRSHTGRGNQSFDLVDRTNTEPLRFASRLRSPEYSGRRSSLGITPPQRQSLRLTTLPSSKEQDSPDESPAESSEPKQSAPDSASGDSQPADTVWDELDDLKSRIKKLELTGKLPPTSHVTASDESMERPRTATTAPTTIDSSPKHERRPEGESVISPSADNVPVTPSVADIHPLLHSALAKAKSLLNPSLYRSLEATATEALGMASIAGFSAASITNGAAVSDRHLRRKADTMCRNLTDLCLALCDGKNEPASAHASPIASKLPTIRYSRSIISNDGNGGRPMSRLEARRSSILGTDDSNFGLSPRVGGEDVSGSDQEPSFSQRQELRRVSRASSRLGIARPRHDEVSGDEDPTVRPRSRAMTDASSRRTISSRPRDGSSALPQRSPSLRESLISRRANTTGPPPDNVRPPSRIASMPTNGGRRRHNEHSVTPVVEEDDDDEGAIRQPIIQPKRRVSSFANSAHRSSRRTDTDSHGRAPGLSQRRHIAVE